VPVEEFLESLDKRSRRKYYTVESLLEEFGQRLGMPYCKYIGDHIYELRFRGIEGHIRVMYFFVYGKHAILTNGFIKKSQKMPFGEKAVAIDRRQDFLERDKNENP
jgi:phage-related protein